MQLSVIIPCFNAANTIATQLEALADQDYDQPWEVIIADNGSTDDTVAIVKQYQQRLPNLRLVDASARPGAAYARNLGVSVAESEWLAFCDADDQVAPGWVAALAAALAKADFVVGSQEYNKLNQPWLAQACRYAEGQSGIRDHAYRPWACANNLGVKRSVHQQIGGFDETLLAVEDVDYCWRAQQAGVSLEYAPKAQIHYRYRPTMQGLWQRWQKIGFYDIFLLKKHQKMGAPTGVGWPQLMGTALKLPPRFVVKVRDKTTLAQILIDCAFLTGHIQGMAAYRPR